MNPFKSWVELEESDFTTIGGRSSLVTEDKPPKFEKIFVTNKKNILLVVPQNSPNSPGYKLGSKRHLY